MGMSERTCDGHCCAAFYLPVPHEEMTAKHMCRFRDGAYIAAMVLPLTADAAAERLGHGWPDTSEARHNLYTCRFWDHRTRLCVAYDDRPAMCRDYPYGKPCEHGCDYQVSHPKRVRKQYAAVLD